MRPSSRQTCSQRRRVPVGDQPADHRRVVPLGRAEQVSRRAAARQASGASWSSSVTQRAGVQRKASSRRVTSWSCAAGGAARPADPVEQIGVGALEQRLVAVELGLVEAVEMGLGKRPRTDRSRACRGARSGTAAACGGYRLRLVSRWRLGGDADSGYRDPVRPAVSHHGRCEPGSCAPPSSTGCSRR